MAEKTFSMMEKTLSVAEKTLGVMEKVYSTADKTPSVTEKTFSVVETTFSVPDKTFSKAAKTNPAAEIVASVTPRVTSAPRHRAVNRKTGVSRPEILHPPEHRPPSPGNRLHNPTTPMLPPPLTWDGTDAQGQPLCCP